MTRYLFVILLILSVNSVVYGQVPLSIDPQFDRSRIDFNLWNNAVVPMHDQLTEKFPYPELKIDFLQNGAYGTCGKILFGVYPININVSDFAYQSLTHEYGHSKRCDTWGGLGYVEEGRAESEATVTYRKLSNLNPTIKPATKLFIADTFYNLPANVAGGASSFYNNLNGYNYDMAAAKFEMLINRLPDKNFNRLHQEMSATATRNQRTYGEYYEMLDRICLGKIDGVPCSTFFQDNPATFENGPDSKFFGIYAFRNMDQDGWLLTKSVVNPTLIQSVLVKRVDGANRFDTSSNPIFWQIQDAAGKVEVTSAKNATVGQNSLTGSTLPEGAHKLTGCLLTNGSCDQNYTDTSFFHIYKKSWERGKIIIIANDPAFADLTNRTFLTLINPSVGITTEIYPGMLVVNLNGSTDDITVTDGNRVRIFTPDHELSRIVLFTQRDQPYLYSVTNGANFKAGSVVPGSIDTLFTWGATHTDLQQATSLPLSTSSCKGGQGETRVLFIQNGVETKAPFIYCSQSQLNVQTPSQLQSGAKAQACVELNSTRSCISVDVAETDPAIFVLDWVTKSGAILQNGKALSIYATGLGAVNAPPADGKPALSEPLSITTNQPTVTLDGAIDCPVVFSGLAPGFVGLYQVNCILPDGVHPGKHSLTISTNNIVSNTVSVSIQ